MIEPTLIDGKLLTSINQAERWEKAFSRFLVIERGWHILPTCDMHGDYAHAPQFQGFHQQLIEDIPVPDLLATRDGGLRWFEIKHKSHADWHRRSQRYVTGLAIRLWDDYLRVQEITGVEVTLVFIHAEKGLVVGGTLKELTAHISHRYTQSLMDKEGTLFFKFDTLPRLIHTSRLQKYMEAQP